MAVFFSANNPSTSTTPQMFRLNLREMDALFGGDSYSETMGKKQEEEVMKGPKFTPRLYIQRYERVIKLIGEHHDIKKVVDFGCAECGFLRRSRFRLPRVKQMIGVDVDPAALQIGRDELEGLTGTQEDFFMERRSSKLNMQLYKGDVTQYDSRLKDTDAVVAIELIEHLPPEVLEKFPEAVFGRLRPRLAIVTTPNQEFNRLFEIEEGKFRHWDHKFEWTRYQFRCWALSIVRRYRQYRVRFEGAGDPTADSKHLGYCSQIAVFELDEHDDMSEAETLHEQQPYEQWVDITYACDPCRNRHTRIRNHCDSVFNDFYYRRNHLAYEPFKEVDDSYGKGVLVSLDLLNEQLLPDLRQYIPNKYQLISYLVGCDGWGCYSPGGFDTSSEYANYLIKYYELYPESDEDEGEDENEETGESGLSQFLPSTEDMWD